MSHQREMTFTAAKGIIGGSGATVAGAVSAWHDELAFWLGVMIALATLVSLALDIRRKVKRLRDEANEKAAAAKP